MKRIAHIGTLLKKIYRSYSLELLTELEGRGFTDLRPSFLEILLYLAEQPASSIKNIGLSCGLKKQTMTSHLNELERRVYIRRESSLVDKREQKVKLTEYGEKFKFNLLQVTSDFEKEFASKVGEVELNRVEIMLENLYRELTDSKKEQPRLI